MLYNLTRNIKQLHLQGKENINVLSIIWIIMHDFLIYSIRPKL